MKRRWTEEDLKKLRPGMVGAEKSCVKIHDSESVIHADNQQNASINLSSCAESHNVLKDLQATGTTRKPKMNKTEARFAQMLDLQFKVGEIAWWAYEPLNLRLGVNCYYRIDFMVMKSDGRLIAYEVKGKWEDDALVKIRTAAEKFPWPFIAVRWVKGAWEYRHF